jgi:aryl-alcohol dehydrogenase-like predicted oxidoreductase
MTSNRLILGTSRLGLYDGRDGAFALLDAYVGLGGTVIDTASVYSDWVPGELGRSETIIGEWMAARGNRRHLGIHTKGAHPPLGHMDVPRLDRTAIRNDVELSLRRLGIDHIELWYLHRDDVTRPVSDILHTLGELRDEGKIGSFGCSNWTLPRILEAQRSGGPGFAANQALGNVLCRLMSPPADTTIVVLDDAAFWDAAETGMSLMLFTSQAQGVFEKRRGGRAVPANYANPACDRAASAIEAIAAREGLEAGALALRFLLALGEHVRPVIGPNTVEQLRRSYAAGNAAPLPAAVVREVAFAAAMQDFLPA